jgi:hypothetical protein
MDCEAFETAFWIMVGSLVACRQVYTAIIVPEELHHSQPYRHFGVTWFTDVLIKPRLIEIDWVGPGTALPYI